MAKPIEQVEQELTKLRMASSQLGKELTIAYKSYFAAINNLKINLKVNLIVLEPPLFRTNSLLWSLALFLQQLQQYRSLKKLFQVKD